MEYYVYCVRSIKLINILKNKKSKMKYIFFVYCLIFTQLSYGQLKGAVTQTNVPDHVVKEKKAEAHTPAAIAKNNAEKLTKSLNLTSKQSKDLHQALLEYETNIDKTNKSKLSNKEKYVQINKLNRARQTKLKTILTKEQYNSYIMSFP